MSHPLADSPIYLYSGSTVADDRGVPDPTLASVVFFEMLFENVPVGVVLLDTADRVVRANPAFLEIFGHAADEVPGRTCAELIVPDSQHPEEASYVKRALHGERVRVETVRRRSDGSLIDVVLVRVAVAINGEPVAVYAIYQDVTQQKRSEAERHELLARERRGQPAPGDAQRSQQVLATAAAMLAGQGSPETLLKRLARFLVPELADSCIVYLRDGRGEVRRVDVAFADPAQEELLRQQLEHYPPVITRLIPPVARALHTGEPQLLPEVSISALKAVPGDTEHVSVALLVGLNSLLVVPLIVESRIVGAISLGTAESGRRYHADDLLLAEEIARHAAAVLGGRLA
jgi:PAS domain S-box-containing protein